jgi:branched-chain amino acid transport system substrate-binding protein
MAVAVVPIANERKILLVSPTTSTDELEGLDDFFLRVYPSADRGAPILARHLYRDAGKDRVSIVYDLGNRAYTESFAGAFEKEFVSIGGTVTGTSTFTSGPDVDFLGLAREIADRGAPAVHIVANALDTAMLCQQFSKIGYYPLVVTGEWSVTPDILSFGGHTVEGLRFFHTFDRGSTQEAYISFRDRFEDRFHYEPGFAAVHGYDAMRVVLWALEQGPDGDASALKRAILKRASFQGLQTDFRFDETGDVSREHFLLTIQDGAFVRLR